MKNVPISTIFNCRSAALRCRKASTRIKFAKENQKSEKGKREILVLVVVVKNAPCVYDENQNQFGLPIFREGAFVFKGSEWLEGR